VEHAVHAEPNADVLLGRLDVNVCGPVPDRLVDDGGDELDDGRLLHRHLERRDVVGLGLPLGDLIRDLLDLLASAREPADGRVDVTRGGDHGMHLMFRDDADVVERIHVRGVRHRHEQLAVALAYRQSPVAPRHVVGQQSRAGRIHPVVGEVHELETDLFRESAHEVGLLHEAEVDQHPAEEPPAAIVLFDGLLELFGREEPLLYQDLAELLDPVFLGRGVGRSHQATTLRTSSIEVSPRRTFSSPSWRRVSIPCSIARRFISSADACSTVNLSISSLTGMIS